MKSLDEVRERIEEESRRLHHDGVHMTSIIRGWLEALEWVIEDEERDLSEGSVRNK